MCHLNQQEMSQNHSQFREILFVYLIKSQYKTNVPCQYEKKETSWKESIEHKYNPKCPPHVCVLRVVANALDFPLHGN